MRKMMKIFLIQCFISLVVVSIVYLMSRSIKFTVFAGFILLFFAIINPSVVILNRLTQRTNWYKNQLADALKFTKIIRFDLEICNLGSNSGKYSFAYEEIGLKGENWAIGPQTLSYDFRILKNYFSYLKEGATVLIPLCPYSSCIKDFEDDKYNHKYYIFLHPILIQNYSQYTREKVMRFVNTPFQSSPLTAVKRLIKDVEADNDIMLCNNSRDEKSIEENSSLYINNWKEQFSISKMENHISDRNYQCMIYNTNLLYEMISFCLERSLKPVIILPPVTKALSSKFSNSFRENYIYSFVRNSCKERVPFLNYLDDERFIDNSLFLDSYLLNSYGRKIFTKTVLQDLKILP